MYIEFSAFRNETNERFNRNEINQELLNDKISKVFEALSTLVETNEKQHQEILKELKGEISVVEWQ